MKIHTICKLATVLGVCAALVGLTTPARAADVTINSAYVQSVMTYPDGSFFVTFSVNHPSCINANNPKRHYVRPGSFGINADGAKLLYASAMMALAAGRGLSAVFDDTDNSCALRGIHLY